MVQTFSITSLNRTFYGIEIWLFYVSYISCAVLIVPFMELK